MKIYVDGKLAVLKKGFSFEFVRENRLFLGRDGYTLNLAFPMKGCTENIAIFGHINRLDVSNKKLVFDCSIIAPNISLHGTVSVVKITNVEVECQFAEGRCSQVQTDPFEETYIDTLDLGKPTTLYADDIDPGHAWGIIDGEKEEVALPWINNDYPEAPNNWVKYIDGIYWWADDVNRLSWQPYLIVIAKRICNAIGYTYNFAEWESSNWRYLLVCNTLPASWYIPEYARALPHWTVTEFFEKLELLMGCEFDFDHKSQSVTMSRVNGVLQAIAPVKIDTLVDSYSADMSTADDTSCDYIAMKRLAYKECSHSMQPYYACDWVVVDAPIVAKYDTLDELINSNKMRIIYTSSGEVWRYEWGGDVAVLGGGRTSTVNYLLYAADVDTYFIFVSVDVKLVSNILRPIYSQIYVLQPVNVFGSGIKENDDTDTEEIEFVPACIIDTYISEDDDQGYMLSLSPGDYDGSEGGTQDYTESDPTVVRQPLAATKMTNGEESTTSFYDEIYLGYWDGTIVVPGKSPFPTVDTVIISRDWEVIYAGNYSLRLNRNFLTNLPKCDPKQKYVFSWLSDTIPNPRAIFHIRGKRYLCEKITATFTEKGMSQLLKGEFYPLLDN